MNPIEPIVLVGAHVRLEPLAFDHLPGLLAAATEARETYMLTNVPGDEVSMRAFIELGHAHLARGVAHPFATIDLARNRVVGSTRFGNIERWEWPAAIPAPRTNVDFEAAEIGWTWLAASAQRTAINTEAKLLMLTHAFEAWRLRRMNLKTDARNARSRAAIERIGGKLDGILRAHMPAFDGGVRDSAMYSIVASEWPAAKAALVQRLTRRETTGA